MLSSDSINQELFEVIVPEVYNKCIPKYYMGPNRGDLPRLNGRVVSWEEYAEAHPEFVRDEEFTPDMVYNPCEMNETSSMETVAGMIDFVNNNIPFSIANPDTAYPKIIEIINEYLKVYESYVNNATIVNYVSKAKACLKLIEECHLRYQDRKEYRTTGNVTRPGVEFDRIERMFEGV